MKTELKSNEEVFLSLRKHWLTLVRPVFITLILLLITLISVSDYRNYLIICLVLSVLWLVYSIVERNNKLWIVTNLRVIDESGVFSINSKESPLDKINNVSYRQSLVGRIFNFGDVQIQTAAEMGSTIYPVVENPRLLKDTITKCQDLHKQSQIQEQAQKFAGAVGGHQDTKTDIAEELTRLYNLKEKGIITEEEFKQRKIKLLNS